MSTYRVDCWKSRNVPLKDGDDVKVIGDQSVFNRTRVKAREIKNLTQNVPVCSCGEVDSPFETRVITERFEEKGKVVSVTETKDGFWFDLLVSPNKKEEDKQ
jgi:transketolase C-terminal domain/subunit